jgi:hypothetical protein
METTTRKGREPVFENPDEAPVLGRPFLSNSLTYRPPSVGRRMLTPTCGFRRWGVRSMGRRGFRAAREIGRRSLDGHRRFRADPDRDHVLVDPLAETHAGVVALGRR